MDNRQPNVFRVAKLKTGLMQKNTDKLGKMAPKKDDDFKVAAIQMASGSSVSANLEEAERLISGAASEGAELVVLPEYFSIMGVKDTDKLAVQEPVSYTHL